MARKLSDTYVKEDAERDPTHPWSLSLEEMKRRYGARAGDPDIPKEALTRAQRGEYSNPHRTRWYNPAHRIYADGEPPPEARARAIANKGKVDTKAIDDALEAYYTKCGGTIAVNDPVPIFLLECKKIDIREGRDSQLTQSRKEYMLVLEALWQKQLNRNVPF